MLLRPTYPALPEPRTHTTTAVVHGHESACPCAHIPAPPTRGIAPVVGLGVGAVAAVVLVGIVLTALVTAVAVGAVSVAVAAVVLRSLLGTPRHR
ncbi:hypothetical protein [Streptomyces silvisoli]|uniref:SpdD protein n=1 Tax=Streptomyces silvisoli TaxID=3034235 RepID=A0ABT5ZT15_9ACTN|nr:hypothetical protein [Streptomyces silvisoli]MDF3292791.1 hypothetical protein [Streptomyces silvisoli]